MKLSAKSFVILILLCLAAISSATFLFRENLIPLLFTPRNNIFPNSTTINTPISKDSKDIEVVAKDLDIPWEIAFLPSGEMLVTERSGKLLKIGTQTQIIQEIEGVKHIGEGGLLGLALHPNFDQNHFLYLYLTTQESNQISNRVERYKFSDNALSERKIILTGIKGSSNHDGGRIAFGPDNYLYITTGDAQNPNLSQDKESLNGKILRIKDDGTIPIDNPFGNAVYSLGHRNPQGIAWDQNNFLWATEHGPSGLQTGYDEINFIRKGANYGWPIIKGDEKKDNLTSPVLQSGSRDTWAPAGLIYWDGSLFFAGLKGEALYEAKIKKDNKLTLTAHFKNEFGRIRAVALGQDRFIYISTSNRDDRGELKQGDDKIIKINPRIFR